MTMNTLRVMWFVPPAVAVAASWREVEGFSVEARRTQSSDEQYEALKDGSVDAVVTAVDNVLHWNQRQGPNDFLIVAQVETTTPLQLIGSPKFSTPSELRGANILVDAPENGFVIALRAILKDHGLGFDDYSLTPVGGVVERYSALVEGKGDATLLGPPFNSLAVNSGLAKIASVQDSFPDFPGQVVVIRRPASRDLDCLKTWLKALGWAVEVIPNNIERLRAALETQGMPEEAALSLIASAPMSLIPDVKGIDLVISHRLNLGLVGANSNYEQIVDCSFL